MASALVSLNLFPFVNGFGFAIFEAYWDDDDDDDKFNLFN